MVVHLDLAGEIDCLLIELTGGLPPKVRMLSLPGHAPTSRCRIICARLLIANPLTWMLTLHP